jgi:hypothetical protein
MNKNYVCDCGRTEVSVSDGAKYPYDEDSGEVHCTECGSYVKDDPQELIVLEDPEDELC